VILQQSSIKQVLFLKLCKSVICFWFLALNCDSELMKKEVKNENKVQISQISPLFWQFCSLSITWLT